jgi:type I restriction enzyme S subunit
MAEMKDSCITWCGKIPTNWNIMPNKYVMYKKKELCPVYKGEDILSLTMYGVIVRDLEAGGKMPKTFDKYQIVHPDNLLMCLFDYDVTPRCIGLIKNEGLTSPAYSQFVLMNGNNPKYYYYYYLMIDNTKELLHLAKNLRHSFTEDQLGAINTPVPSLSEQQKIANFLDAKCTEIDTLSEDIQKQVDILEEYKKSLVFNAVSSGIRNEELGNKKSDVWGIMHKGWDLKDTKYIFEILKRIAGKEGYDILSVTQKGLKIKDISNGEGQIAESYAGYQFVYPTDYVMNHMDLLTGWVDCSNMFGVTSPDYRVFRLRDKNNYDLNYYKYVIQACYSCKIFYSLGQGVANLGRWRLQTSTFNNFMLPVPPLQEQIEIANYLNKKVHEIEEAVEEKKQQLEVLEEYKKSIIYEYVTGKKEVPDIE